MSTLGLVSAIVGAVGVGGLAVLFFVAPPLFAAVIKAIGSVLAALWNTRPGLALLVGGACLWGGLLYGEHIGAARVRAEWDATNALAAAKVVTADKAVADKVDTLDKRNTAAEAEADAAALPDRDKFIAGLPPADCNLTGEALKRMQDE